MKSFFMLLVLLPAVKNFNITEDRKLGPVDELDFAFDEFPNLEDVVPTLTQKSSLDYGNQSDVIVRNIAVDINKINMGKFRKRMDLIMDKMADEEMKPNISRRQAFISWNDTGAWERASSQMSRRKTLDLMLQTLYMARHKIKLLEANKYFNFKDTGFRIAFTYRRLSRLYRRMTSLYTYGNEKRLQWTTAYQQIVLHSRCVRLHVDFTYLFWVIVKVDGKYRQKHPHKKNKKEELTEFEQYQMSLKKPT